MRDNNSGFLFLAALVALLWFGTQQQGCDLTLTAKPTQATYVYEKDKGGVPAAVMAGLNKLNDRKILATEFEVDTKNGNQEVPAQYAVAVANAKELPSLVVQAGAKVLSVVKSPKTEDDVTKAVP